MNTASFPKAADDRATLNLGYIWLISLVAALGGLLFGWDWVVIGGAKPFFQPFFHIENNSAMSGWANSCALIGCLVGALIAGALSDKLGRKRLLIAAAILFAVTSIGNALAQTLPIFIAWRMLGGVAIGLASSLSPMYIAEVAPAKLRGRLVAINQLTIVIGVLLAQFVNWWLVRDLPAGATDDFIVNSWFGQVGWRWMFALTAAPACLFFLGMLWVPESPRWLIKNGRVDQARSILERIGGADLRRRGSPRHPSHALRKRSAASAILRAARPSLAQSASSWESSSPSSSNGAASTSSSTTPRTSSAPPATTFPTC